MRDHKFAGIDDIPVVFRKADLVQVTKLLIPLIKNVWNNNMLPSKSTGVIVQL